MRRAAVAFGAAALLAGGLAANDRPAGAEEFAVPIPADAHRVATRIASWGPRPAASDNEARAHRLMARVFQRAGLRVGIQEFRVPGRGRSRNVIGVYQTPRSCLRIVMAHTDSMPDGPGANDNGSGLGVVATLAGRLSLIDPWCDVWLVATGAEERLYTGSPDHLGARALAARARSRGARDRLRFALSLDEVGRDRPFWLRSPASAPRPKVEGALLAAAKRVDVPVSWVRDESTGNSDHREFQLIGLPGAKLGVGAGGEPCRHMACDVAARLDTKSLALARRMAAEALRAH
jgi:Peptidase family M28